MGTLGITEGVSLVLEGGGMRGVFTAGVLDYFLEKGVEFPYIIGVSAGSTGAMSYISKQKGRTLYADTTLMRERPYMGMSTLLRCGEFIDMDFLFGDFARNIYPFDWDMFSKYDGEFEVVASDIEVGKACYFGGSGASRGSFERLALEGRASSSLPFINRYVEVDGVAMMDGGLTDSIPLQRACERGYERALVVLTQCRGYRKSPMRYKIPSWVVPRYAKVAELLNGRAERYNAQLEWVESLEDRGDIDVIRPIEPLRVGRLTRDEEALRELYNQGWALACRWVEREENKFNK